MTTRANILRAVVVAGVVLVGAGCDSSDGGGDKTTSSSASTTTGATIAPDVPAGFNTCTDIPKSVLDSEKLRVGSSPNADSNAPGGIKWRGCRWASPDSYAASITTTNITVDAVRGNKKVTIRDQYTIAGRQAVASHAADATDPLTGCTLYVEMQGGSLEFLLDNPRSNKETGNIDTCVLARQLAEKVVPLVPAGA